jgi:hypothetical protein
MAYSNATNIYPLKNEARVNMNSDLTSKETQNFSITNNNWLMKFKEIILVYCKKHTKTRYMDKKELFKVKAGSNYDDDPSSCRGGETTPPNCGHQRVYCSSIT